MPGLGEGFYEQAWSVLTEPVFKGLVPGIALEFTREQRSLNLQDESVGSFLKRRFGSSDLGDNIFSGLLHGIYAGDINQLSVKSIFPILWEAERGFESILKWKVDEASQKKRVMQQRDAELTLELINKKEMASLVQDVKPISLYSFKEGISVLPETLTKKLESKPNVKIRMGENLTRLQYDEGNNKVKVRFLTLWLFVC
jgi:oxygen-dependent protoporphyrinogen oxidase